MTFILTYFTTEFDTVYTLFSLSFLQHLTRKFFYEDKVVKNSTINAHILFTEIAGT